MTEIATLSGALSSTLSRSRAAVIHELRRLLPASESSRQEGLDEILPFGLAALDGYLPGTTTTTLRLPSFGLAALDGYLPEGGLVCDGA